MLVVYRGRVCAMAFDNVRGKWVYIPVKKWAAMTSAQKDRYTATAK